MKVSRLLFCSALLMSIIILAACGMGSTHMAPALLTPVASRTDTAFVTRGTVEALEIVPGITRLPTVAARSEAVSGPVAEIFAWPGDQVEEGQLIARLDASLLEEALENLEAGMVRSRAMHRLQLEEASLQTSLLELAYADALAATQEAIGEEAGAENSDGATSAVLRIRDQLDLQRLNLSHITQRHELNVLDFESARSGILSVLEHVDIRAPISGEVVYTVLPGTWINARDPVLYIAAPGAVFVEYIYTTYNIEDAFTAQEDGEPIPWDAERILGIIDGMTFELRRITLSHAEQAFYRRRNLEIPVRFEIQSEYGELPPTGEAVLICVYSAWVENALRVPSNALFRGGLGEAYVYRIVEDRLELVHVTTGVATSFYTEILEGLYEGDEIFIRP
ncbi:MAG: efflux RND transporter periplasmic adaptor subunit [Oscillospiraceae bacterium]|nr:efflux RND transporter periplasmic adaptor subunit [Oscillospiraceae bacterium]